MGATAGLALQGFGAGFSASAQRQSGEAQNAMMQFNAANAEEQALDAESRGKDAERRHRVNVRRLIGAQRASFAAGGVDPNQGNAVDVTSDTASLGELDALNIRLNAAREAWGYRNQAIDYRYRGALAEAEAENKSMSTLLSAGGNALYNKFGFGATTRSTKAG